MSPAPRPPPTSGEYMSPAVAAPATHAGGGERVLVACWAMSKPGSMGPGGGPGDVARVRVWVSTCVCMYVSVCMRVSVCSASVAP
jgi:hypothetical protein